MGLTRRLVAAAGRHTPERLLPTALTLRSLLGDGPVVGHPDVERLLVVAPHPDDETLACGGTLALLADAGCVVHVVVATDGTATRAVSAPSAVVRERRRGETRRAAEILGARDVRFLGFDDGDLASRTTELADRLADLCDDLRPQVVVTTWFLDAHPDHRAASDAVVAADLGDDVEIWGAEVWTPTAPTRLIPIDDTVDRKRRAAEAHQTARGAFELDAVLGLNRYRSIHGLRGRGHAEAFLALSSSRYAAAAAAVGRDDGGARVTTDRTPPDGPRAP